MWDFICKKLRFAIYRVDWVHITLFFQGSNCAFSRKILVSLIILVTFFYVATTNKNLFCVKIGVKLAHLSVASKFHNTLIPLSEVWSLLSSKHYGKLLHIYKISVVRIHLWKLGVYITWGDLRFSWEYACPFSLKILVSCHRKLLYSSNCQK